MSPRPKYQVFISSTYGDLHEERKAVTWAILSARHIPAGMENFTATDDRGWQTILSVVNRSDYYVLILAGKYGSLDHGDKSWTEKEYEYAVGRKIPVLVFLRSKHSITADKMEDDPVQQEKLESFKRRVRDKHLCKEWTTTEELVGQVMNALSNHIIDDEETGRARPGWYRGDEMPATTTLDEFARLSEENARLNKELADARSSAETAPRLMLVDREEQPLPSDIREARKLKLYDSYTLLEDMVEDNLFGAEYLALNAMVGIELGVTNVSPSLVEHVTVDISLNPILGFYCGWGGRDLVAHGGRLSNVKITPEYRDQYPDSIRQVGPNHVRIRLRVPRVLAGGTEFLPEIIVIGAVKKQRSWFNLDYKLNGSLGASVAGYFRHEIMFKGLIQGSTSLASKLAEEKGIRDFNNLLIRG